jgi:hypothetical protein
VAKHVERRWSRALGAGSGCTVSCVPLDVSALAADVRTG